MGKTVNQYINELPVVDESGKPIRYNDPKQEWTVTKDGQLVPGSSNSPMNLTRLPFSGSK